MLDPLDEQVGEGLAWSFFGPVGESRPDSDAFEMFPRFDKLRIEAQGSLVQAHCAGQIAAREQHRLRRISLARRQDRKPEEGQFDDNTD